MQNRHASRGGSDAGNDGRDAALHSFALRRPQVGFEFGDARGDRDLVSVSVQSATLSVDDQLGSLFLLSREAEGTEGKGREGKEGSKGRTERE